MPTPRWQHRLRQAGAPGSDSGRGQGGRGSRGATAPTPAVRPCGCRRPAAGEGLPGSGQRTRNAPTLDVYAGRPDTHAGHWTPVAWTSHAWTCPLTPDTGHRRSGPWPRTGQGDQGTAGTGHRYGRHRASWPPPERPPAGRRKPCPRGRRLRRSAAQDGSAVRPPTSAPDARRRTGQLLCRSAGQAAPRRIALLGRFQVERRAEGLRSCVIAHAMQAAAAGHRGVAA